MIVSWDKKSHGKLKTPSYLTAVCKWPPNIARSTSMGEFFFLTFYCTTPPKPTSKRCFISDWAVWKPTNLIWDLREFSRPPFLPVSRWLNVSEVPTPQKSVVTKADCDLAFRISSMSHSCRNSASLEMVEISHDKKYSKGEKSCWGWVFPKTSKIGHNVSPKHRYIQLSICYDSLVYQQVFQCMVIQTNSTFFDKFEFWVNEKVFLTTVQSIWYTCPCASLTFRR